MARMSLIRGNPLIRRMCGPRLLLAMALLAEWCRSPGRVDLRDFDAFDPALLQGMSPESLPD